MDNILTHSSSQLTCIDPRFKPVFESNIAQRRIQIEMIWSQSEVALRDPKFRPGSYHFTYIDGAHNARNVLTDAVLTFPLLIPNGIMIFDDYQWKSPAPAVPQSMPMIAIDAFLTIFKKDLRVLHQGYQVAVEKMSIC